MTRAADDDFRVRADSKLNLSDGEALLEFFKPVKNERTANLQEKILWIFLIVIFGALDVLIFIAVLYQLLVVERVVIKGGAVTIRNALLGIGRTRQVLALTLLCSIYRSEYNPPEVRQPLLRYSDDLS